MHLIIALQPTSGRTSQPVYVSSFIMHTNSITSATMEVFYFIFHSAFMYSMRAFLIYLVHWGMFHGNLGIQFGIFFHNFFSTLRLERTIEELINIIALRMPFILWIGLAIILLAICLCIILFFLNEQSQIAPLLMHITHLSIALGNIFFTEWINFPARAHVSVCTKPRSHGAGPKYYKMPPELTYRPLIIFKTPPNHDPNSNYPLVRIQILTNNPIYF